MSQDGFVVSDSAQEGGNSGGPLTGVRIVDFTQLYQGPLATQLLADMGADVLKVEPPRGEFFRRWSLGSRFPAGESVSFLSVNGNKRSIVIDLKHSLGRDVALRLIASADVVIENFRPGVMDRLGLGYEALAARNSRLVYCASSGYGQSGPYRDYPGQDLLVQALAGTLWLNGKRDDPPTAVGFGIADAAAGLHIVAGVLAALLERSRSGTGQRVDVNLLSSLFTLQTHEVAYFANTLDAPVRPRTNTTAAYAGAPLGVYQTQDGYIALSMMPIGPLARLIGADELDGIESDNEIEHRDEIHALLEAQFRTRPRVEWLAILRGADVWCAPVQTLEEIVADPQVVWNRTLQTVEHPLIGPIQVVGPPIAFERTPARVGTAPPLLGQHSVEVLTESGFEGHEIAELLRQGVVAQWGKTTRALPARVAG